MTCRPRPVTPPVTAPGFLDPLPGRWRGARGPTQAQGKSGRMSAAAEKEPEGCL
ncbi:hypothetical protein PICMEDRAFT_17251 [Pichia membranifaciens NRRL Y-2026]|uniref:Uncharacterized protein n=1 Tax=Pichia membranifaciens NRRL Y-2026 TaxID=763406 RepID=A0A1E3NIP2_9ASCO|nr:hypothetical protein PICMEDRAFT_17251 [Pichia membranifaciens NRRL Y-2026]ODQ46009.1 hypothetical protein PICMEDRAFT_17251 [Pichia membranifaciens NRRL Y-2026]